MDEQGPAETDAREALERRFHDAVSEIYEIADREIGYRPSALRDMLNRRRGLETARTFLNRDMPSEGFARLWEEHRLDLSLEAYALRPEFRDLFTGDELERARVRLKDAGYLPPETAP
jgi:hypothetical protein